MLKGSPQPWARKTIHAFNGLFNKYVHTWDPYVALNSNYWNYKLCTWKRTLHMALGLASVFIKGILKIEIVRISEADHGYVPIIVIVIRSFPHSWPIARFVTRSTRQAPHVEQRVPTIPECVRSPPVCFSSVSVAQSLVFLCRIFSSLFVLLPFFFLARLQFTASDYPFGIFKHFVRVVELNHALWPARQR